MQYWLMKSEPDDVSIDDLAALPEQTVSWHGVRNYQARNFMRDQMRPGDLGFFYHSGCTHPGIAGIIRIVSEARPDPTQFDPGSPYHDPKSLPDSPRWLQVNVKLLTRTHFIGLPLLRATTELAGMRVLARGNRLSITPVSAAEWACITERLMGLEAEALPGCT